MTRKFGGQELIPDVSYNWIDSEPSPNLPAVVFNNPNIIDNKYVYEITLPSEPTYYVTSISPQVSGTNISRNQYKLNPDTTYLITYDIPNELGNDRILELTINVPPLTISPQPAPRPAPRPAPTPAPLAAPTLSYTPSRPTLSNNKYKYTFTWTTKNISRNPIYSIRTIPGLLIINPTKVNYLTLDGGSIEYLLNPATNYKLSIVIYNGSLQRTIYNNFKTLNLPPAPRPAPRPVPRRGIRG